MREYSSPLTVEIPATGNLTDDVVRNAEEAPDGVAFSRRRGEEWEDVTAGEFLDEVRAVAKGLVAAGIQPGERVALISKTRYEWTLVDYAIWFAGAVTVPVYETSSAEQIEWILGDSGATAVVAEGPAHTARIAERRSHLEALNHVWSLEDNAVEVLRRLGEDISDADLEVRRTTATPLDLATIIYTSGTTGRPKGCLLTHGNFMFELGVAVPELHELFEPDDASTLLFLPLAHVFARIIQVGAVKARVRLGHSADIKNLLPDLDRVPADVHPRRTAGVREGVQHRLAERDGRGPRRDLRARGRHRDRLLPRPGPRQGPGGPARPPRPVLPARLRHACGPHSAAAAGTPCPAERRSATGSATSTGASAWPCSRATGSPRRPPPSPPTGPTPSRSGPSANPCPAPRCAWPRTASCSSGVARCSPATGTNEAATGRGARARRLVPHRRRRRDRRGGLRPDHRPEEGDPGDRRRQERRARGARGPGPRPRPGQPVPGRRRRPAVHRRPGHHRPGVLRGLGGRARQDGRHPFPRSTIPTSARRSSTPSTRRTPRSRGPSRSASS